MWMMMSMMMRTALWFNHPTLNNDLLSYYKFEWNANDAKWVNNWTLNWVSSTTWKIWNCFQATWWWQSISIWNAFKFPSTQDFTISLWAYYNSFSSEWILLSHHTASVTDFWLHTQIWNTWWWYIWETHWWYSNYNTIIPSVWVWYNLIIEHSSGWQFELYRNWTHIIYDSVVNTGYSDISTFGNFMFFYDHPPTNFNWKIDECWIWTRLLTSQEKLDVYNSWTGLVYN